MWLYAAACAYFGILFLLWCCLVVASEKWYLNWFDENQTNRKALPYSRNPWE